MEFYARVSQALPATRVRGFYGATGGSDERADDAMLFLYRDDPKRPVIKLVMSRSEMVRFADALQPAGGAVPAMKHYDPDWIADGRLDARKYPIYLIVSFWVSIVACLIGLIGLPVSVFVTNLSITAVLFFVLAAGLGSLSLVRSKARSASTR
jgi:hypothetical protein